MSSNRAALEELRWQKFPVLNDGFVALVDAMGDDAAIAQAARVSYGAGTRSVSDDAIWRGTDIRRRSKWRKSRF